MPVWDAVVPETLVLKYLARHFGFGISLQRPLRIAKAWFWALNVRLGKHNLAHTCGCDCEMRRWDQWDSYYTEVCPPGRLWCNWGWWFNAIVPRANWVQAFWWSSCVHSLVTSGFVRAALQTAGPNNPPGRCGTGHAPFSGTTDTTPLLKTSGA